MFNIPEQTYDIVYADFPWYYPAFKPGAKYVNTAARHYSLIPDKDLLEFPLERLLNSEGIAFLWATCPRLDFAIQFGNHRGLKFSGVPFIWVKTRKDGVPMGAKGMRPRIVKPTTELVVAFTKQQKIIRPAGWTIRQVIFSPRREHSRKPDEIYDLLETMYPNTSKIELFARSTREGWNQWGNEVGKFKKEVV
jgi:N6-adenosine-specific RNA methylase IME4